ncbi:hypothetical protein XVE_4977, partial [Xanthomonas vesicatoria ATCC 35937]
KPPAGRQVAFEFHLAGRSSEALLRRAFPVFYAVLHSSKIALDSWDVVEDMPPSIAQFRNKGVRFT